MQSKSIEIAINIPFQKKISENELFKIIKNCEIPTKWKDHIEYLFTEVPSELFLLWCNEKNMDLSNLKIFYEKCIKNNYKNTWLQKLWEI